MLLSLTRSFGRGLAHSASLKRAFIAFGIASASVLSGSPASAEVQAPRPQDFTEASDMVQYLTPASIESVEAEVDTVEALSRYGTPAEDMGGWDSILSALSNPSTWVTIGKKAWEIVIAGRPVANVAFMRLNVMPVNEADWTLMERWQGPASRGFSVTAKNLLGMTVARLDYAAAFNFGGSLGGKGAYLSNVAIVPTRVEVSWGFQLNAHVEAMRVVNTGTVDSPVPGLELQITYLIDSPLKHIEGRDSIFVTGSGEATRVLRR